MKGVALTDQVKRTDKVLHAGKRIIAIATKVRKSLKAKEKRIWGDVQWMNEEDKLQADLLWTERREAREAKKLTKDNLTE